MVVVPPAPYINGGNNKHENKHSGNFNRFWHVQVYHERTDEANKKMHVLTVGASVARIKKSTTESMRN